MNRLSSVNNKKFTVLSYSFNSATPITTKFLHRIATMNGPSWVAEADRISATASVMAPKLPLK